MTVLGLVTPWLPTAVLLVGLGSVLGAGGRGPVADQPVTRIERALPGSPPDESMGAAPDAPGLPQGDAGPTRLGAVALVGVLAARHGPVTRPESSRTRAPPDEPGPAAASFPIVPSRIDKTPLDPPHRWSTGRGPPTLRPSPASAPRSARFITRAQETEP